MLRLATCVLFGIFITGCGEEPKAYEPVAPVEKPKGNPEMESTKSKGDVAPPPPPPPPP